MSCNVSVPELVYLELMQYVLLYEKPLHIKILAFHKCIKISAKSIQKHILC